MPMTRSVRAATILASLLLAPSVALAQSPGSPPAKTIGAAKTRTVPSLIVMNAAGASLQGNKLTLTGIAPNSIVFADRPVRSAGHALTAHLLEEWATGGDSFAKDPPNATVSVLGKDAASVADVVVVLKSPKLEGDRLTFDVQVLEGDLAGAQGPAAVFIDIIGLPFTPLSFAGAARRTAFRGAWYAGAAAAAGAAVAAPYYHPYYNPYYAPPAYGYPNDPNYRPY